MSDEAKEKPVPDNILVYHGDLNGEVTEYFLLHPNCFVGLFEEIVRQQGDAALWVATSNVANIRESLGIPG
jgi:hypothetical protein